LRGAILKTLKKFHNYGITKNLNTNFVFSERHFKKRGFNAVKHGGAIFFTTLKLQVFGVKKRGAIFLTILIMFLVRRKKRFWEGILTKNCPPKFIYLPFQN